MAHRSLIDTQQNFGTQVVDAGSDLSQSELATQAGLTAALAGRVSQRIWWPIHKVAIVSLILVWIHGVLAGVDTPALLGMYLVTGLAVLLLAISRYVTKSTNDELADLAAEQAQELILHPTKAQQRGAAGRRSADGRFL